LIDRERIHSRNNNALGKGDCIIYWMQQAQRVGYNHALVYAIKTANDKNLKLFVYFGIIPDYPHASIRQYQFMLEGLAETADELKRRNIGFILDFADPVTGILSLQKRCSLVVCDRGYTRIQRQWRRELSEKLSIPLVEIETDVIVPVETALQKQSWSAAVLRPKIQNALPAFLRPLRLPTLNRDSLDCPGIASQLQNMPGLLSALACDKNIPVVPNLTGGYKHANAALHHFVREKLLHYDTHSSDPTQDIVSHLSPYLHFGQISSLEIALLVKKHPGAGSDSFLEELIVRRELAMNFCHYCENYDQYDSIPPWAQKTLHDHEKDERPVLYSLKELERAKTHDPYWNAAQKQMVYTGYMHGYMRMYWGKKIIEWSPSPQEAYRHMSYLNHTYFLDGRDPNGYTGIAWCFGVHDRAWKERPIFGKVRYMNEAGLKRKFDIDQYALQMETLR